MDKNSKDLTCIIHKGSKKIQSDICGKKIFRFFNFWGKNLKSPFFLCLPKVDLDREKVLKVT